MTCCCSPASTRAARSSASRSTSARSSARLSRPPTPSSPTGPSRSRPTRWSSSATACGCGRWSTTSSQTSARTRPPERPVQVTLCRAGADARLTVDGLGAGPRRRTGRARLRALLPRRPVAHTRQRRRGPRPVDRRRGRGGARRLGARRVGARRRRDVHRRAAAAFGQPLAASQQAPSLPPQAEGSQRRGAMP